MCELKTRNARIQLGYYDDQVMPRLVAHENSSISAVMRSHRVRLHALVHPNFNLQMVYAGIVTVMISVFGCLFTSTHVPNPWTIALGFVFAFVAVLPLLLYLQEKGKLYLRDSMLAILWALFFTIMLGYPATVAARLGSGIPLQDLRFAQWDRWLGIHVPNIAAWATSHWLGILANKSYLMLFPFMQIAILLPILAGKLKYTQRFLTANLVAFAIGLPIFALLPGVDPWFGDHYTATPDLALCKSIVLLAIRRPGPYLYQYPAGAICFPSFHVIWAILSVHALWGFRLLRIPACLFSALIILSTLTTGNHYFCDVLAGIVVAWAAMITADWLSGPMAQGQAIVPRFRNLLRPQP